MREILDRLLGWVMLLDGDQKNVLFFWILTVLSAFLTLFCRRYVRIMDYASERSSHNGAIPRSGGLAIVITVCVGILVYRFIHVGPFIQFHSFWGLFLSSLMIAIISLYDDLTNRGLLFKIMSQLAGVAVLFAFGIVIKEVNIPFYGKLVLGAYSYPLTMLWIIGMTNAFNFMDGLNGLAAGTGFIVATAFTFLCLSHGSGFIYHISYFIAAACLGFLILNYPSGSIFMGDVGSTFLGFCFAAIAILAANYDASHTSFMVVPIMFMNFIMETLVTFISRLLRGQKFYAAHRSHPYQLMNQIGISAAQVTVFYWWQSLLLSLIAWLYVNVNEDVIKLLLVAIALIGYSIYYAIVYSVHKSHSNISDVRLSQMLC